MERSIARAIEWDCMQLVQKFYAALDEKRYVDLAGLFTDNGVWNRLGLDLVGPEAILAAMDSRTDWLTAHVVTNVMVTVDSPERAQTRQYITLYRHEGVDPAVEQPLPVVMPLAVLLHRDVMVLDGGNWKFSRKTSRAIMADSQRVTHYARKPRD